MDTPAAPQIIYRADLAVLLVRWPAEFTAAGLRAGYEEVLHVGSRYQASRWLLDLRRRPPLPLEVANWAAQDFLPRAAAVLVPHRLRVAFLIPPQRLELMRQDAALHPAIQTVFEQVRPYDSALFSDEGEAIGWLTA